jgi:hypothetical protein
MVAGAAGSLPVQLEGRRSIRAIARCGQSGNGCVIVFDIGDFSGYPAVMGNVGSSGREEYTTSGDDWY